MIVVIVHCIGTNEKFINNVQWWYSCYYRIATKFHVSFIVTYFAAGLGSRKLNTQIFLQALIFRSPVSRLAGYMSYPSLYMVATNAAAALSIVFMFLT